jgi:polyisoprenoid-binding protein YceI
MTATLEQRRPRRAKPAVWRLGRAGLTFELKVKPRHGPVTVAGVLSRIDGTVEIDADGRLGIRSLIDTSSVQHRTGGDPRLDVHVRRTVESSRPLILFESQKTVRESATGRFRVKGHLRIGARARRIPMELHATVNRTGTSLSLVGRIPVDHRRLGLTWLPAGPLKAPTEVVVRADLVPSAA